MMGLGYLGSSSSSSSSNLSPLAPPFTVDRSNHNKPVLNSNPISHFNDPSYGVPFTSSWPYSHSSTARQDFLADSARTTTLASNDSGYMIPESVHLQTGGNWSGLNCNGKHGLEQISPGRSHWSAVYPSPKRVADSFSYNLNEAKPFYPPYASSSSVNNDDIPLVTFSEPSYDLLSTSGIGHSHGDETSQVDYTRSLSGLEYNQQQQQDSVWSTGLPEGKQVKKMETDDSFFSEEANLAASLAYNNFLNQGGYGSKSSSKSKDDPSLFYYADIIRRANNTTDGGSGTSFSANNQRLDPNDLSSTTFRAFPMFSESHPLIQSPEPPEDLWNTQNSYNPYEKRYHMFDSSASASASDDRMSASTLAIKPPAAVPAQTISSKSLLEIGNFSALNINSTTGLPLKENRSSGSFLGPNQLSFQIGRSTKEERPIGNEQLKFEFKARPSSFQVPEEMSIPNVNTAGNVTNSFEQFDFDHHNPAEDSPCWKGAPTSQFLPFESQSPQPPMKKLQTGNADSCSAETDEEGPVPVPVPVGKEHSVDVDVDVDVDGVHSIHDTIEKPKKEDGSLNESASDANSETRKQLKLQTREMDSPEADLKSQLLYGDASGVVKSLYNLSDLLLAECSFALKEHEREALGQVIRNLGVCMSREVEVSSTSAHKSIMMMMPQQKSLDMSQEVRTGTGILHGDKKAKSDDDDDSFGKNVEKLLEHASVRVEGDPPKDHNMVQAIKKVLAENVECKVKEMETETLLLYKNLWLEAEAELCSLSFRARFNTLTLTQTQTQTHKSQTDAAAIKKEISSCNAVTVTHTNTSTHIDDDDDDDVEAGVMARFNILKRRENPNPVCVEVCGKGSQGPEEGEKDIDPWVMDRFNILKRRGDLNANTNNDVQQKQHFQDAEEEEAEAVGSGGSDWEHILKDEFSWRLS